MKGKAMYDLTDTTVLVLAENRQARYRIVIGEGCSESVKHAARELKAFFLEISGADFAIGSDSEPFQSSEIILGVNRHTGHLDADLEISGLGDEGFIIRTYDRSLAIIGSDVRGTLYGVYTLLEEYFGCRWFTPRFSRIPRKDRLVIAQVDTRQVPVLEYREPYHVGYWEADWNARNKCNGNHARLTAEHGGKMAYCKYFVHTFDKLVPVDEFFDTHPEYFSEVNGVRVRKDTQLCLTNPEVFDICVDRIRGWIKENPLARIISISVNDCYNPCECAACMAVNDREESMAGVLIEFINRIAVAITAEYPDKLIDTLSYLFTRTAPKYVKAHPNVIVRICTIECCFSHPLRECKAKGSLNLEASARPDFAQDAIDWSRCCDRMYVWDYVTNFENFLQPFPNFKVLQPNIRFFIAHGVKGIFMEGYTVNGNSDSGELDQLRIHLLSKLLWNPDCDVDRIINEFLAGFYSLAAPAIREYFDLVHEQVVDRNIHLGVYDPPTKPYLNESMLKKADAIFDRAEILADDRDVLWRVRVARMSVTWSVLARTPVGTPLLQERLAALFADVERHGMIGTTEHYPWTESYERMKRGEIHLHNQ
jgi:hypothetical protein